MRRGVEHGRRDVRAASTRTGSRPVLGLDSRRSAFVGLLFARQPQRLLRDRVAGTTLLDFTDDAVVLPILKWLGMTRSIEGWRIIEITNAVSLRFFDAYLRGAPKPRFADEFPELTVEMTDYASQ